MIKAKNIWNIIWKCTIILAFFAVAFYMHTFHEPWSDEAQSYLLARDNSFIEVFKYIRYEGTPPLWVFIIKLFINFGGSYETLYILPLIISTVGVAIYVFKINVPKYLKVLFPFTYFILCQYTIVARNYCMVFLALMIVASIYPDRMKKTWRYCLSLIFLMQISLHTFLIAGSLFLLFIMEIKDENKFKQYTKYFAVTAMFFVIILIIMFPPNDCYITGRRGVDLFKVLGHATFSSSDNILINALVFYVVITIILFNCNNIRKGVKHIIILFLPIMSLMTSVRCSNWHYGIITILILFYSIITDTINKKYMIKFMFLVLCIVQVLWSINFIIYDYNNNYSAGKSASEYIKLNEYKGKSIAGYGYDITAIQPYFEKNIFANSIMIEKSFWIWNMKQLENDKSFYDIEHDIYIISCYRLQNYAGLIRRLENLGYTYNYLESDLFYKYETSEPKGYIIFEKIEN